MSRPFDPLIYRRDFPVLDRTVYGRPLIYFDNTASSQTPRCVVEKIEDVYFNHKANVHRGVHALSQEATSMMEATRSRVARLIPRDHLHTRHHRGHQPCGLELWTAS